MLLGAERPSKRRKNRLVERERQPERARKWDSQDPKAISCSDLIIVYLIIEHVIVFLFGFFSNICVFFVVVVVVCLFVSMYTLACAPFILIRPR